MASRRGGGPIIHLAHPFTARSIGWADEAALPEFHSGPHASALRYLSKTIGARCMVSYLTDRRRGRRFTVDGLSYRYWPRSLRQFDGHASYRREWSATALAHDVVSPADVTIINSSGHGTRFSQTHALVLRGRRRPYVAMVGGDGVNLSGRQLQFFRNAALVAVHNQGLYSRIVRDAVPANRVMIVPLGVDTSLFTPTPHASNVRERTIIYVGRVVEWKGVHHLIEALAEIAPMFPDVKLRLVGPEPDPDYSHALRDLAARLAVASRVEFAGPLPKSKLPGEYRRALLTVLASTSEGYGMVVAESMACGTPVVALEDSGGPQDMIRSERDGLLVHRSQLASGIAGLLRDPKRLESLGDAARGSAIERLSSTVTHRCFEDIVHRAMAVRASTGRVR